VSVAVSIDQKLALVTASVKVDPSNANKLIPDDSLSVIDISSPTHPAVVQSLHTGAGAEGVAINRAGTLALVTNTNEGTVSVFSIARRQLAPLGKIMLEVGSRPTSAEFLANGKTALVVCPGSSKIVRLSIDGTKVTKAGETNLEAKNASLALPIKDGSLVIVNGTGPAPPNGAPRASHGALRDNKVSIVDLSTGKIVTTTDIGPGDEYIGLSPDGNYLEATVPNGSHSAPTAPGFHDFGLIKIFQVSDASITPVAEAKTGHWCQGAVWSNDGHVILLQCATEKEIEVFRFDGKKLAEDFSANLKFAADPSGIATSTSH
jgi:DNA-binding beta-propeller fold protein YncE